MCKIFPLATIKFDKGLSHGIMNTSKLLQWPNTYLLMPYLDQTSDLKQYQVDLGQF